MSPDDGDDAQEEYVSGPYCEHWGDPSDCDSKCACGHTCPRHNGDACDVEGCDCKKFTDEE